MAKQLSTSDKSRGGSKTKTDNIDRQHKVEKLLVAGYSLSQIASEKIDGETLGSITTIRKDIDIIRSRWLDSDPEWFHRARLARIEAVERLKPQLIRLNKLIIEIQNGEFDQEIKTSKDKDGAFVVSVSGNRPKKLVYAESQLTAVIKAIYEIDADFDPEQYIDSKIQESVNHKIEEATPTVS